MQKISLDYPITIEGTEVKSLNMRRAKVKDQLAADKGGGDSGDKEIRLFANLCEVSPAAIEELDMLDYAKLQKEYRGFLSPARKK